MIDLAQESLLPLVEVPEFLHTCGVKSRQGGKVPLSAVYAWIQGGLLETVKMGRTYTSVEALARMAAEGGQKETAPQRRKRKRERTAQATEQQSRDFEELRALGYKV